MRSRAPKSCLRVPASLYSIGAGRLLGDRFLLLEHRGRRSGRRYRAMLEALAWREDQGEAVVMSGFGPSAGWYRGSDTARRRVVDRLPLVAFGPAP